MSAHDALQKGIGIALDVLHKEFMPNVSAALCKSNQTERGFEDVLILTEKWFFEYKSFRQRFLLEISDDNEMLTAAIAQATHVLIDDDYYVIVTKDTIPPKGVDVTWKIYCERFVRKAQRAPLFG